MPGLGLDLNLDPELQATCRRLSYRGAYSPSSPKSPPLPTIDESSEEEPSPPPPPPTSPRTTGAPGETLMPTVGAPLATWLSLAPPAQPQPQQAQEAAAATTMLELEQRRQRLSFAEHKQPVTRETLAPKVGAPVATSLALASSSAEYQRPATGERLALTVGAPVATSLAHASPAQSQSQQAQEAAAAMLLEQRRHEEERASFAEYQRRRQQALAVEAGLQQSLAAQQLMLYTVDGRAAGYETKWNELHTVSQGLLLQIEDRIREHRDDSEQLDQCRCFDDLSLRNMNFELSGSQITQKVVSISTIMNREKNYIESLMTVVKEIMWNTEFAICSFVKLRPRFVYLSAESANSGFSKRSGSSGAQTDCHQLLTMTPKFHCHSCATRRPSPFVQQTVARFEDHLGYCCKLILELEEVQMKDGKTFAEYLESLSNVMSNVHDYLIHVASKVEHFHHYVETVESQDLNDRWCRGDLSNPFRKANKRGAAKPEATDRIIHPMLHRTPRGQRTTLVAAPMHTNKSCSINQPFQFIQACVAIHGTLLILHSYTRIHAGIIFVQDCYPVFCYFAFPSTIWRYTSHAICNWIESETIWPLELDISLLPFVYLNFNRDFQPAA